MSEEPTSVPTRVSDADPAAGYPTNRLYAVIDTSEALQSALLALDADPAGQHARVLCGEAGRDRIDAAGEHASLFGRLLRVPNLGVEAAHVTRYDDELVQGHYVVEIETSDEAERTRLGAVLLSHGAHFINFYGRFAVEQLAP